MTVDTTYEFYNKSSSQEETQRFRQVLELERRGGRWVVVANRQ
jgi:hypothetical protein